MNPINSRNLQFVLRVLFLLSTSLLTSAANAGLFEDSVARESIKILTERVDAQSRDIAQQIRKLDDQLAGLGIIQLLNQIESQQKEISVLRGQLEVLANQYDQVIKRQNNLYIDTDTRLRTLETNLIRTTGSANAPSAGLPIPATTTDSTATGVLKR